MYICCTSINGELFKDYAYIYFCLSLYGKVHINLFTAYNWECAVMEIEGNYL